MNIKKFKKNNLFVQILNVINQIDYLKLKMIIILINLMIINYMLNSRN